MSNFLNLIIKRRSTRKFKEEFVKPEQLEQILKAGLMAPTSKRCMSWEFVVVEEKSVLQQLSTCKANGASFLANAPLAIVILGNELKTDVWIEDASIAAVIMQLQAEELGLGSCWIQIRNRLDTQGISVEENVCELLNIPEGYHPLCILAIGVKDEDKAPFDESKLKWEKVHLGSFKQTQAE